VEIFLGDYIDRGPASREVLDPLIARSQAREMVCLKGNHETFVECFLNDPAVLGDWRNYGGLQTLLSYGLAPSVKMNPADRARLAAAFTQALPLNHRLFLGDLRPSFTCGDYFFVHAGVQPGIPLEEQHEEDLLWIREDFLLCEADFSKIVVHGHTPVREPDIRPTGSTLTPVDLSDVGGRRKAFYLIGSAFGRAGTGRSLAVSRPWPPR
jgi:serine/threonine protein phosphatase 1